MEVGKDGLRLANTESKTDLRGSTSMYLVSSSLAFRGPVEEDFFKVFSHQNESTPLCGCGAAYEGDNHGNHESNEHYNHSHAEPPHEAPHKHIHTSHCEHGHATRVIPGFQIPERQLSQKERNKSALYFTGWVGGAAALEVVDVFAHATPGLPDDIIFHCGAALCAIMSMVDFNKFWRGYETTEGKKNTEELRLLKGIWKERTGIRDFVKKSARFFQNYFSYKDVVREPYNGEGNPTSPVTYAVEVKRGLYEEREGPLKGWRKRVVADGVLAGSIVVYPLAEAFQYGIMKNLHDRAHERDTEFAFIPHPGARYVASFIPKMAQFAAKALYMIPYGFIRGGKQLLREKEDGSKKQS